MHLVCCVIDALPHRHVGPDVTPRLWQLVQAGGWNPEGGRAVMTAATYPNHRTFVTGLGPSGHGVRVNADRHHPTPVPTVFSACRDAGVPCEAVLGDHKLVTVMGADDADAHWPPGGTIPEGTPVDELGYPADAAVLGEALAAIARHPALLVLQLNDPDTAGHLHGPDSADALTRYRATDAVLGQLVDELSARWHDTVLLVVSDHDQETVTDEPLVDLIADSAEAGVRAEVHDEGSAALVRGDSETGRWLRRHPDLADTAEVPGGWLVWSTPGRWFGRREWAGLLRGVHGSPRTRTQVAVAAGGHPAVPSLAHALGQRVPHATDWAPTMATLLGVELPGATGRPLR